MVSSSNKKNYWDDITDIVASAAKHHSPLKPGNEI
jgi:hypothetical protein